MVTTGYTRGRAAWRPGNPPGDRRARLHPRATVIGPPPDTSLALGQSEPSQVVFPGPTGILFVLVSSAWRVDRAQGSLPVLSESHPGAA